MVRLFPKLMKALNPQIQKSQWTTGRINRKKTTSRHTILKLLRTNDKENVLKVVKEKDILHTRTMINITTDVYQKQCNVEDNKRTSLKYLKENNGNREFYTQWKYPSRIKVKNAFFWDKKPLKDCFTNSPEVKQMFKKCFHAEGKWFHIETSIYTSDSQLLTVLSPG